MRKHLNSVLACTFSLLVLCTSQSSGQVVAFRNVGVIPMTHETVLRDQTVIVRGEWLDKPAISQMLEEIRVNPDSD